MLKKILSLVLALSVLAGLLIPVSAASTITLGQAQNVTVIDDEVPVVFQFIPDKTGYYVFLSSNSAGCDPFGYIMDEDWELLEEGDDTPDSMDFSITCHMTAGKSYYLAATTYSGSAEYTVQIKAQSLPTAIVFDKTVYAGSIRGMLYPQITFLPEGCVQETVTLSTSDGRIVSIGAFEDLYLGIPGTATVTATSASGLTATCTVTVEAPPTLATDTPWTLDAAKGEQYLQFVAPTAGWYGISSAGDEIDPWVEILNPNLDEITGDDAALPGDNFFCPIYLEANQLCYFGLNASNYTGTAQVTLQKLDRATAITLPGNTLTGYVDTVCHLKPEYAPQISIPEELTWKSSNENLVYVDETGYVSFLAPGNAVITVTSETGLTDSIAVTVLPVPTQTGLLDWGICGPNLQWQLSSAGVLTVTGSGEMYSLYDNDCGWEDHSNRITQVVLPEGLTSIGAYAFQRCNKLTQVTVPSSVRRIGNSAFSGCSSLTQVTLPSNLETMGILAFEYCDELQEITLPDGLERLPFGAFLGCASLSRVQLPKALVSIGDQAFSGCPIEALSLPDTLKTLGFSALAGAELTELTLPQGLTELRDYALVNGCLKELTIPSTVTMLGCGFVAGNEINTLRFLGNAPVFDEYALEGLNIDAYYPAGNPSWDEHLGQNYGGTVNWIGEGVTLSGTVSAAGTVTLTLEEIQETVTTVDGSYRFCGLQPGDYTLTVSAANHVTRTYRITVADSNQTQDVKLHLIGDINGDGRINMADVGKLNSHVKGISKLTDEYQLLCANVNGGILNMGDTGALYAHIRGTKKLY